METMLTSRVMRTKAILATAIVTVLAAALVTPLAASDKKTPAAEPVELTNGKPSSKIWSPKKLDMDISKLVWPPAPAITRIRYVRYFAGEPSPTAAEQKAKKASWMDRLAGVAPENQKGQKMLPFQLLQPYMMAVDSKGLLYVPDSKVGAIFIFNAENKEVGMIKNGKDAHFVLINAIAFDDDDRMFVTDGQLGHVVIFDANRKVVDQITGLLDPVGIAIDTENRLVYVVDTQADQVAVFDADTLKPIRRMGTAGQKHESSAQGDFALPSGVAVDKDGNVYVTDTMNSRVEEFDADGNFIREFGKNCDGQGCTPKPKGIAIDSDGNVWVADPMLDVLQIFSPGGTMLGYLGGHGNQAGMFSSLQSVAVDKNNRVFAADQYPGRVQMFRYITNAEAEQAMKERDAKRSERAAKVQTPAASPDKTKQ